MKFILLTICLLSLFICNEARGISYRVVNGKWVREDTTSEKAKMFIGTYDVNYGCDKKQCEKDWYSNF